MPPKLFVPQIDKITSLGLLRDSNRFYFSVLWALSPISIGVMIWVYFEDKNTPNRILTMPIKRLKEIWYSVVYALLCLGWTQFLWWVELQDKLSQVLLGSLIGRSFGGQTMFYMSEIVIGSGVLLLLVGHLTGYIPRNIRRMENERKSHTKSSQS